MKAAAARHNLEEPSAEVAGLISHAVHERLKNLVEKLAVVAQYRIDLIKVSVLFTLLCESFGSARLYNHEIILLFLVKK